MTLFILKNKQIIYVVYKEISNCIDMAHINSEIKVVRVLLLLVKKIFSKQRLSANNAIHFLFTQFDLILICKSLVWFIFLASAWIH